MILLGLSVILIGTRSCDPIVVEANFEDMIDMTIYDYIIDNVREISVVDLLHVPLKSLIGFSIKEKHNGLWKNLDRLFQARNKVAHVGKCYYMSKTKKTKTPVDGSMLNKAASVPEILKVLLSPESPSVAVAVSTAVVPSAIDSFVAVSTGLLSLTSVTVTVIA